MPMQMLPGMRLAQRARDAALLYTVRTSARPVVLIAGNGHVRKDYGVPSMMGNERFVSIGLVEAPVDTTAMYRQFDYLWITDAAPCARFRQGFPGRAD